MSAQAQMVSEQPQKSIRENKSLVAYLVDKPLERIASLIESAQVSPGGLAKYLEEEGVQPIETEGEFIDLKTWFNENAAALVILREAIEKLTSASQGLTEEGSTIVKRVAEMQASHEAYYGWATMAALRDAYREAGIGDTDRSQTSVSSTAYALQAVYDAMPEELKAQTRDYLAQKYSM